MIAVTEVAKKRGEIPRPAGRRPPRRRPRASVEPAELLAPRLGRVCDEQYSLSDAYDPTGASDDGGNS